MFRPPLRIGTPRRVLVRQRPEQPQWREDQRCPGGQGQEAIDPGDTFSVGKHKYEMQYSPADLGAVGPPPQDGGRGGDFEPPTLGTGRLAKKGDEAETSTKHCPKVWRDLKKRYDCSTTIGTDQVAHGQALRSLDGLPWRLRLADRLRSGRGCGAQIAFAANDAALRAAYEDAIRQWDSDSFFVREQATRWLQEQGSPAIPMLVEAAGGDNLEVTCRAIQCCATCRSARILTRLTPRGLPLRELAESTVTSASQRAAWPCDHRICSRSKRAKSEVLKLGAVLDNGDTFRDRRFRGCW